MDCLLSDVQFQSTSEADRFAFGESHGPAVSPDFPPLRAPEISRSTGGVYYT